MWVQILHPTLWPTVIETNATRVMPNLRVKGKPAYDAESAGNDDEVTAQLCIFFSAKNCPWQRPQHGTVSYVWMAAVRELTPGDELVLPACNLKCCLPRRICSYTQTNHHVHRHDSMANIPDASACCNCRGGVKFSLPWAPPPPPAPAGSGAKGWMGMLLLRAQMLSASLCSPLRGEGLFSMASAAAAADCRCRGNTCSASCCQSTR